MKNIIIIAQSVCVVVLLCVIFILNYRSNENKESSNLDLRPDSMTFITPVYTIKQTELFRKETIAGDINAYENLKTAYLGECYGVGDGLFYALLLAHKYNYSQGYFDVYNNITASFDDLNKLGKPLLEMALTYLIKAAEMKNGAALLILSGYYKDGEYVEKNETLGNQLLEDYRLLYGKKTGK